MWGHFIVLYSELCYFRRYVQIVDCAKYLGTQTSQEETTKGMVSVLTNHGITSAHVSIRVKQVITTAQHEGHS